MIPDGMQTQSMTLVLLQSPQDKYSANDAGRIAMNPGADVGSPTRLRDNDDATCQRHRRVVSKQTTRLVNRK